MYKVFTETTNKKQYTTEWIELLIYSFRIYIALNLIVYKVMRGCICVIFKL